MTHLHLHSMFSTLDGISSSKDYAKKAKEFGHKAIALTDHGRMNGVYFHQKDCLSEGIKPIIGVEMYLNDELIHKEGDKRKRTKDRHIILLASNDAGYKNLLKLNYTSMSDEEHFYYSPRITTKELFENSEGIICGTACLGSPFSFLLQKGKVEEAEEMFVSFLDVFKDRFYAEIQLNELTSQIGELSSGQKTYNNWIIETANKYSVPVVVTGDVHYAEKGMDQIQTLSIAIRDGATIDNLSFEIESKNLYYHDVKDFIEFNSEFGYNYKEEDIVSWSSNSDYIADKANFLFKDRTKTYLPKMTDDDDTTLILRTREGLCKYFNVKNYTDCPEEYKKRLSHELSIIIRKGFSSYFLLLEDIMNFANKEKISRGVARGSAGSSLCAFVLDITRIDPLKFNLLFERFLSSSRCPDLVYDYFVED